MQDTRFNPWVGKIPWRRAWQPKPVFLPGESHGQRSLAGYGKWSCKELDMTKQLTHTFLILYLVNRVTKVCIPESKKRRKKNAKEIKLLETGFSG